MRRSPLALLALAVTLLASPGGADSTIAVWRKVTFPHSQTAPIARRGAGVAYLEDRQAVVVYGGVDSADNLLNDTWLLDASGWHAGPAAPPGLAARFRPAMAYHPIMKAIVMAGGLGTDGAFKEVWKFDGVAWSPGPATGFASDSLKRWGASMAYHPGSRKLVLYGGMGAWDDTWTMDETGRWKQVYETPGTDEVRSGAGLAYDNARNVLVLAGGSDGLGYPDTTWMFTSDNKWVPGPSLPPGAGRVTPILVADAAAGGLLYAGGLNNGYPSDAFVLKGTGWQPLPPMPTSGRAGAGGVYAPFFSATLLVGGYDDETHHGDLNGFGTNLPLPPLSSTWVFAEGTTRPGFVEYLTLANFDTAQASAVDVTYAFDPSQGPGFTKRYTVRAATRVTIRVNDEVGPGKDVSAVVKVASGAPVLAERPMYFYADPGVGGAVDGGHDVVGVTAAARQMTFAEGYTGPGFVEYLTIANPDPSRAATVRARYVFSTGSPLEKDYVVAAGTRATIRVNDEVGPNREVSVFLRVVAGPDVVAERPMYFVADPGLGLTVAGGHNVVAVTAPKPVQMFAEGYTGAGFVEYLTIANADPSQTSVVQATYAFESGDPLVKTYNVAPASRFTVKVNSETGPHKGVSVSLRVLTGPAIVAERPMYFYADPGVGGAVDGGHDVAGADGPGAAWDFAEGYTGPGFKEFLTLANFADTNSVVQAQYTFGSGPPKTVSYTVGARRRLTIDVNKDAGSGQDVSVRLIASGAGVVAERPMYFVADPGLGVIVADGSDVMGYRRG